MDESLTPADGNGPANIESAAAGGMRDRFRGFLPVVVDIETGGFNCQTDAILEIAVTLLSMTPEGELVISETHSRNVEPFEGANLDPSALEFTGIDPENPLRGAVPEDIALGELFAHVRQAVKAQQCNRAILVGHNAHFDAGFLNVATERLGLKRNPFHPFPTLIRRLWRASRLDILYWRAPAPWQRFLSTTARPTRRTTMPPRQQSYSVLS